VVEDEWANYFIEMLHASGQGVVVAAVATLAEAQQALAPGLIVCSVDVAETGMLRNSTLPNLLIG
jgi:hypothetical protein